jgi:hypothetical protein
MNKEGEKQRQRIEWKKVRKEHRKEQGKYSRNTKSVLLFVTINPRKL